MPQWILLITFNSFLRPKMILVCFGERLWVWHLALRSDRPCYESFLRDELISTLGILLNACQPQFANPKNGNINIYFTVVLWKWVTMYVEYLKPSKNYYHYINSGPGILAEKSGETNSWILFYEIMFLNLFITLNLTFSNTMQWMNFNMCKRFLYRSFCGHLSTKMSHFFL